MAFHVRVTVEGEGRGRDEMVRAVWRALDQAGVPMANPQERPKPPRHLRVVTASGDQQ